MSWRLVAWCGLCALALWSKCLGYALWHKGGKVADVRAVVGRQRAVRQPPPAPLVGVTEWLGRGGCPGSLGLVLAVCWVLVPGGPGVRGVVVSVPGPGVVDAGAQGIGLGAVVLVLLGVLLPWYPRSLSGGREAPASGSSAPPPVGVDPLPPGLFAEGWPRAERVGAYPLDLALLQPR